ncbi:hypothetical protein CMUS01_01065 [Colletotrichum musicola]|uniref:Uncharacterized protein n=1 Tax=Colletotrichum musicola TaxID=2175873 RepID=A0A8H6NXY8_9PEZI|nr:hypothetical protein CMUS01_01065 [Colletotrichum musicola]
MYRPNKPVLSALPIQPLPPASKDRDLQTWMANEADSPSHPRRPSCPIFLHRSIRRYVHAHARRVHVPSPAGLICLSSAPFWPGLGLVHALDCHTDTSRASPHLAATHAPTAECRPPLHACHAMPCHALPCRATTHGSRSTAHARRGGKGLRYHQLPGSLDSSQDPGRRRLIFKWSLCSHVEPLHPQILDLDRVKVPGPEPFDSHYRRDACTVPSGIRMHRPGRGTKSAGPVRADPIHSGLCNLDQVLRLRSCQCDSVAFRRISPMHHTQHIGLATKRSMAMESDFGHAPREAQEPVICGVQPRKRPQGGRASRLQESVMCRGGVLDGPLILAKGELAEDRLGTDDSGLPSVPMQAALSKNRKRLPSEKCCVQNAYQEVVLNILKLRAWREVASMAVES